MVTQRRGTSEQASKTRDPDGWADEVVHAADGDARKIAADLARHAPAGYRERTSAPQAAFDAAALQSLLEEPRSATPATPGAGTTGSGGRGRPSFSVRTLTGSPSEGRFHIRRIGLQPVDLTAILPALESFGLVVEESVPFRFTLGTGTPVTIDDIGVRLLTPGAATSGLRAETIGRLLVDAIDALAARRTEVDQLNALVPAAGLSWREVALLRAYASYWAQCAPTVPVTDVEHALVAFPDVASAVIAYFAARFAPGDGADGAGRHADATDGAEVPDDADDAKAACLAEIGKVPLLRWDRALRVCCSLVDATVRTNFYCTGPDGAPPETITLKITSVRVPTLPLPRPRVETWVHGTEVQGIHLRAGPIARGGLRWSERPEDFRTEVLDLMVAQVKKNAIIVPTGAKGGFVVRSPAAPTPADVRRAYTTFVGSLLEITDNLVSGDVRYPPGVVAQDGPDPYLVVAADKGTAEFSDLANEISAARDFWLGDAFASGGSHGYNHKQMGITARGAWVGVRRHFHQLGIDIQREPVLVAGIGDMSGDVFGNGMLLSDTLRLVAAFDHRHVFLDPDPDPATSFAERKRLAELPSSSWADYSPELISAGGGVWSRNEKVVPLAPPARRALGVEAEAMSPPELISAILEAPVDLLWFGGVGTFVRAPDEHDADVGDHTNDEVRVSADRLRARVVGEGGNLGLTQRARIRYSRRGGRINTDFIDNAAGVVTSDREVNLKILLALAEEQGRLEAGARDSYLARAEEEVAHEVLLALDHSVAALARAVPDSAGQLDAYAALIDDLEARGLFAREVESLPDDEEIERRRAAGAGMIRPELAVLLAYAKSDLGAALAHAPYVREPSLAVAIEAYFPAAMRTDFGDLITAHRLYAEIVATDVAGEIVDFLGIVWAHETAAELGRSLADTAGAYWAAREVVAASGAWADLDARWSDLSADADAALHRQLSDAVAQLARTYLRRERSIDPGAIAAADQPIANALGRLVPPHELVHELVGLGADEDVAHRWVRTGARAGAGDVGPVVRATGIDPAQIPSAFAALDDAAGTGRMRTTILGSMPVDRWRAWFSHATLDDVADWRIETLVEILRVAGPAADPVVAVSDWAEGHAVELSAARQLLRALDTAPADPTTIVAVALRRLPRPALGSTRPGS